MLYLILLIIAIFCSAVMDADALDVFGKIAEKRFKENPTRFNKILWEWVDADSWENKYKFKEFLISIGIPKSISTWLAKDVFVIFLDLWHFAKAIMMICFEIPISILSLPFINSILENLGLGIHLDIIPYCLFLFTLGGVLFNLIYYKLRKLN